MTNTVINRKVVITSVLWKLLERGGVQGIQFILSIVLARLLTPDDYGVITLILVFIQIANVFVQSGFNTALIQKTDSDDIDFSSIFYVSELVALVFYCLLFFMAPIIANFYNLPKLTAIIRVISLSLFPGALSSVQSARVAKTMQFKRFFYSSVGSVVCSGIFGIFLAYRGYGAWALVIQQLINATLIPIILWFTIDWHPKVIFSFKRVRGLFSFGWKLLCSALLDTTFRNLYNVIIGKSFSSSALGIYNRGQQFPQVIALNLDASIQSVMLPTLASHKDDIVTMKRLARRSVSLSSFLIAPCMAGLAAIAEPLVLLLLTEKWLLCVPFIQLACIDYMLLPIHTANLTAINALGRSDYFLKLELVKKIVTLLALFLTLPFGVLALAIGQVITSVLATIINGYPNRKLLKYSYCEQFFDLAPSILLALVLFLFVKLIQGITLPLGIGIVLQIIVGISVYSGVALLTRNKSALYILSLIKRK